jgi:class 3 adenylate cyclase
VEVRDLESRNGVWVNGRRIEQPTLVDEHDAVVVGDTQILVGASRPSAGRGTATSTLDPKSSIAMVLSAVERGLIDAPPPAAAIDGTLTILFTDVESSTTLAASMGDHRWLEALRRHNSIVRECIRAEGGTEVKTIGDGFMITFGSARAGLDCAVAIQRALARLGTDEPEWPIRVRIGVHTGEALRERDDVFGTHVNIAARVGGAASGGEILVSGLLHDLVRPVTDLTMGPARDITLKGLPGDHRVHPVVWWA